jgi:translation initiation factor 2B subunit (eIF-2B alpha/beta/delta family)
MDMCSSTDSSCRVNVPFDRMSMMFWRCVGIAAIITNLSRQSKAGSYIIGKISGVLNYPCLLCASSEKFLPHLWGKARMGANGALVFL